MQSRVCVVVIALSTAFSTTLGQTSAPVIVAGIPFAAQEWTTTIFARSDGTSVQTVHRVDVARNTAGSTRRELRTLPIDSANVQPTGSVFADIHDVPNLKAVHLDMTASAATVSPLRSTKPYTPPPFVPGDAVVAAPSQSLGLRSIAGFTAIGIRQNFVFPKGTRSQIEDVTQTTDTWFSPDLQSIVLTEISDSLGNSSTIALLQIILAEPSPTLFSIPQNYTTTIAVQSVQGPH